MASLKKLSTFVAGYRADARARSAVRLHAADIIGAWIAATGTAEGRALMAFESGAPLADRIAVSCALARLSEVDDIHLAAAITPGALIVPAALNISATLSNIGPDDLTAAIVAGYEVMVRLGLAIDGPSVLSRDIWPSYFAAPCGVAAVAARLFGLDSHQTAHALATALIMAAPGTGRHLTSTTTTRWLAIGHAAARGAMAALTARAGFTSDLEIADGDFLRNVFGLSPDRAVLSEGQEELALHQVSFKPWCAARQTMGATQALRELIADGVAAESISAIEVSVLPAHLKMIDHGVTPGDRLSYLTSVQYQLAQAVLSPAAAYSLHEPHGVVPELSGLMERIQVRADDGLCDLGYPKCWGSRVSITTSSDRRERTVSHVPGDPAQPLSEIDLREKFRRIGASVLGAERSDAAFALALSALERPDAILRMIAAMATSPGKPVRLPGTEA